MRVAVCSNQYGTRHQLERLLDREADQMIARGVTFYYEAFGSPESLLAAIAEYDLYLLNYEDDDWNWEKISKSLLDRNVSTKIHHWSDANTAEELHEMLLEAETLVNAKKEAMLREAQPVKKRIFFFQK